MVKVKVLFSLRDWSVNEIENEYENKSIYANHKGCPSFTDKKYDSWVINDDSPRCDICSAPVPDEIQGLIHMLLWYERVG